MSLFQNRGDELTQGLRRGIIAEAEVVVQLAVVGAFAAEQRRWDSGVLQHRAEALRLRGGVGMIGDVQDEKGRDALAFAFVCHSDSR